MVQSLNNVRHEGLYDDQIAVYETRICENPTRSYQEL